MDEPEKIQALKDLLLVEVSQFCRRDLRRWKQPIAATLHEIRKKKWPAVFFGGTPRSLLMSRLKNDAPGKPRDVDLVVRGISINDLRCSFNPFITRETRFGGLQLRRVGWQFDVWPLEQTFALKEDAVSSPDFDRLPETTFFNVEAIAVEVWPENGRRRRIFSGNDQFFRGVLSETIELNREANPFPELCVVRTIVMAGNLGWKVGPKLLAYLAKHGSNISKESFDAIQRKHYGRVQLDSSIFKTAVKAAKDAVKLSSPKAIQLPLPAQRTFWPEDDAFSQRVHLRILRRERVREIAHA